MALTLCKLQFFATARALSSSQSSVTGAIRRLKNDLAVVISDRQARGILLARKSFGSVSHGRKARLLPYPLTISYSAPKVQRHCDFHDGVVRNSLRMGTRLFVKVL